jgi:hypothetical protein
VTLVEQYDQALRLEGKASAASQRLASNPKPTVEEVELCVIAVEHARKAADALRDRLLALDAV